MDRRLDQIRRRDVIAALEPVLVEKAATGRKLHMWIRGVLGWAVAREYLDSNPADGIAAALPKGGKTEHHAALDYREVPAALDAVSASSASLVVRQCLRLVALTAVRSGEARGATWDEFDLDAGDWRIPAERMKGGVEHRVPLSDAAMAAVLSMRGRDPRLVFPSRVHTCMDAATLQKTLQRCIPGASVHGFRSSLRTWCSEQTSYPHAVCEAVLAHRVGGSVERSYARSDLFAQRRDLLSRWAEYVAP